MGEFRLPFVPLTLREEASLADVTLFSGGTSSNEQPGDPPQEPPVQQDAPTEEAPSEY